MILLKKIQMEKNHI